VLCCNENNERAVQVVASRFVTPLSVLCGATVILVPAIPHAADAKSLAALLDGLLLTGSRSHVAPGRYGAPADATLPIDQERDEVALALAGRMIERGKPVYGICRGLQEINVLFGGTLSGACAERHYRTHADGSYTGLFSHEHGVELAGGGRLAAAAGARRLWVNSVHEQGVDRLGSGLSVEAVSEGDGIIEAVTASSCGADVLAVQWHPEWDLSTTSSRSFFVLLRQALTA
jgi:putative glutamine amidotransferase